MRVPVRLLIPTGLDQLLHQTLFERSHLTPRLLLESLLSQLMSGLWLHPTTDPADTRRRAGLMASESNPTPDAHAQLLSWLELVRPDPYRGHDVTPGCPPGVALMWWTRHQTTPLYSSGASAGALSPWYLQLPNTTHDTLQRMACNAWPRQLQGRSRHRVTEDPISWTGRELRPGRGYGVAHLLETVVRGEVGLWHRDDAMALARALEVERALVREHATGAQLVDPRTRTQIMYETTPIQPYASAWGPAHPLYHPKIYRRMETEREAMPREWIWHWSLFREGSYPRRVERAGQVSL